MNNKARAVGYLTWNTGRTYTEHGQRIAAISVTPNGVVLADIDRRITYYLPECSLDRDAIMSRYDWNDRCLHRPPEMPEESFIELRRWLEREAATQFNPAS